MNVKLISVTPDAERLIAYCARVSNPDNQYNEDYEKLLRYCMTHKHWSVFEMADMTVEITTSRAIGRQILRHRSFNFQEFSQRYAKALDFEETLPRLQDTKNRQNSIEAVSELDTLWYKTMLSSVQKYAMSVYLDGLSRGIAKECMRFVLPETTQTRMYMKGNIRSWIHYLQVRTDVSTQKEHRDIAQAIFEIVKEQLPTISRLLEEEN